MLSFELEYPSRGSSKVTEEKLNGHTIYTLNYPCTSNSLCTPYVTTLPIGLYKFEVIGAAGGSVGSSHIGGKGGYSVGFYEVKTPVKAYINLGGKGSSGHKYADYSVDKRTDPNPGGYNGGGHGGGFVDAYAERRTYKGASGGGSSDIRINSKEHSSRIIVAGGGGGACVFSPWGGNGGGFSGTAGSSELSSTYPGGPGNQINGGKGTTFRNGSPGSEFNGGSGSFGDKSHGGGGGGGGYFGGGGGNSVDEYTNLGPCASGGGGSGFIGGVKSSLLYTINASSSTYTNEGHGIIIITVLKKLLDSAAMCTKKSCFQIRPMSSFLLILFFIVKPQS